MTGSNPDLETRLDVSDVLVRYASGIDRKDWALFRTCFTADCRCDYGAIGAWEGVDAITEFMTRSHPSQIQSLHRITNVAVSPSRDGVTTRCYVDLVYAVDGGGGRRAAGYYDDELVRTDDGWRIARRRFTAVHGSTIERG